MSDGSLLARAAELTARLSWVRKYRQQWLMIAVATYNAQLLLEETAKPDRAASDFLESTKNVALDKCDKLDKWIEKHEREQNIMMQEVDPDVAINR